MPLWALFKAVLSVPVINHSINHTENSFSSQMTELHIWISSAVSNLMVRSQTADNTGYLQQHIQQVL